MKTTLAVAIGSVVLATTVLAEDFGGIGLVILDRKNDNEPLRTGVVYPGSPAERAGITPNGFLISVNGTNVVNITMTQSLSLVRGPVGTYITLGLADSTLSHTNTFTVKRSRVVYSGTGLDMKVEFFDQ